MPSFGERRRDLSSGWNAMRVRNRPDCGGGGAFVLEPCAVIQGVEPWKGMMFYSTEISECPHNGTAVLRSDGVSTTRQNQASLAETP
jgi:hypothetical protein